MADTGSVVGILIANVDFMKTIRVTDVAYSKYDVLIVATNTHHAFGTQDKLPGHSSARIALNEARRS